MYVYIISLLHMVCISDPRRLVVAVKDVRTQICQQSHTGKESIFGWGQSLNLSLSFWQVGCYLVYGMCQEG